MGPGEQKGISPTCAEIGTYQKGELPPIAPASVVGDFCASIASLPKPAFT